MVADIARVTYDPTRQYRSVIYQQGRVTLEADYNEAEAIEGEALRLETIDIIGPAGTPDNGYQVTSGTGPAGFDVGPGIFYLGGWRLEQDKAVDRPGDANSKTDLQLVGNDFVACLLITERSVCAVEDTALREVALGGPDSAARARLMQSFPRVPTQGDTCAEGATSVAALLAEDGVTIDPYSDQLINSATLHAGFTPGPASTDPCQPTAAGGYLGADNQMVQVTVTAFDPNAQSGTLLWGWNNASLLYRAKMVDPLTLLLATTPVDEEHAPQQNQMVEILTTALDLGDGNYIAHGQGFVVSLAQGYSFDSGTIGLAVSLPSNFQGLKTPLFVRLWQAEVPFNAGAQTPLDSVSGITVAISMTAAYPYHLAARPFWQFAVRPLTPTSIYPQRYLDGPQPPDGPRQWICDLAVCQGLENGCTVLEDCRPKFGPLTGISGGCCGLVLGPDDVTAAGGLQAVVDSLGGSGRALLSLKPGTYTLEAPVNFTSTHDGLTIESCAGGVIFQADPNVDVTTFRSGLFVMNGVAEITLRNLVFLASEVPIGSARRGVIKQSTIVAIVVVTAHALTIEDCLFTLTTTAIESFGAGVAVTGLAVGVTVKGCEFDATTRKDFVFGVLGLISSASASTEMDQWDVSDCRFENLFCAMAGLAQLGLVGFRHNVVVGGGAGIILAEANLGATSGFVAEALTVAGPTDPLAQAANLALRPDMLAQIINGGAPILAALPTPPAPEVSDAARKVLADQLSASGAAAYHAMVGTAPSPAPSPATGATAKGAKAAAAAAPFAIDTASFQTINDAALAAEIIERSLTPAIRIEDNEITLTAGTPVPWIGIAVVLAQDEPGSVIVSGNRVVVPDAGTNACALLLAEGAIVTGNFFWQLNAKPGSGTIVPSLAVVNGSAALAVTGNVIVWSDFIYPQRTLPQPSPAFEFLNTVL